MTTARATTYILKGISYDYDVVLTRAEIIAFAKQIFSTIELTNDELVALIVDIRT